MATYEDLYQDACEEDAKERTRQKVAEELLTDERFLEKIKPYVIENDTLLNMVMDGDYKEVKIKKAKPRSIIIEWLIDYDAEETTFVQLQNKYPNSDIQATTHKGKITWYQVTERIKIEKN